VIVCWATVVRTLKRSGASYRRARYVSAKAPNPLRVASMHKALDKVRLLAQEGACDVIYGDESDFALWPSLPYLWQPKGKTLAIRQQIARLRLSVMGLWKEAGLEEQILFSHVTYQGLEASDFITLVEDQVLPSLRRPCVLMVDNARVHRCRLVEAKRKAWKQQGLHLWYLPPYCPNLNRIETLWRLIKHHWLEPTAYTDMPTLYGMLTNILHQIGTKYRLSFV
jgi:transposase